MSGQPLIVIRPEPGNEATVRAARELGLDARAYPLFRAEPVAWDCPDPGGFDGLVLGSANALRHAGDQLRALRRLPVHAVGNATAGAARAAGFAVAQVGTSDLAALLEEVPGPTRLLRLAGEEHVPSTPGPGISVETRVVYAVRPVPCPEPLIGLLRSGCVVMLHSAAAARHFAAECGRLDIPRQRISLACLAARVATAADQGWLQVASVDLPHDAALLALAAQMCQITAQRVTDCPTADER